jgi:DNA-binding response OmpR family regulator
LVAEPSTRVLLVGDDQDFRHRFRTALELDFDVVEAADGLEGNLGRAEVWVRGQRIDLSATEYRLLAFLARRPDRIISPTEILTHVWGTEYANELGYVKSYVRLVRRKIEESSRMPRYLVSRRGLGYTLVSRPSDSG